MFNKKRLFVAGAFIIALLFMTMYAGNIGEQGTTPMRIVKFIDGFNSAEINTQNIEVGGKAEVPKDPEHEDLLFIGWYNGDTKVTEFENIMKDLIVTSQYVDDINNNGIADSAENTYTITFFDTLAGANISDVQVLTGMNATAPTAPVHENHTFTGWSRGFTNVTSSFTVNARYRTTEAIASPSNTLSKNTYTVAKNDRYEFNSWDAELTNETKVEGDTTYTANFKDIKKPTVEIQNVSKYNPKSFDIYATDLESGLKRIDYSLFINDNTDYLGGDGQWIEGSVYEFEQRNITEYYSLEKVKYLFEDLSVGEYTLRVTVSDNEGNTTHATNFNFEVDKITPEFNLTTGYHNDDDIQIIITEKNFSQVKIYNQDTNKTIIEKNLAFTLTEEATYRLTAKDKADNETTIWVAIDKTNPEIYNNDEPIINDSYYKEDVVLNIQDKFLQTVKINGPIEKSLTRSDFEVGKNKENFSYSEILTESGNYEVIAKDKFGNTTTINFVIDKELPSGEVIDIWSNNDINQRYATKGNNVSVRFRTTEEIQEGETNMMIAGIEVENVLKKDSSNPGENVYQGTIVVTKNTPEGLVVFNIEVTDLAGNVGTIPTTVNSGHTVTIDRTNPILEESDIIIDYFNPKTFSFTASDEY
ncbi:MAG: InlB B-repeat-containing protein [Bacilli bacterium]|nr:InlB B-repeat-containing protein [Bacilli bacterium]